MVNSDSTASTPSTWWTDTIGNITKLFDSGAQVYDTVVNKTAVKDVSTSAKTAVTPIPAVASTSLFSDSQFKVGALLVVGGVVALMLLKRK